MRCDIVRWWMVGLSIVALGACSSEAAQHAASDPTVDGIAPPARPHHVIVWSTDSMETAMTQLARRYEADAVGARVEVWCAGGAEVLKQRIAGGPCDVLVIGDSSQMSKFAAAAHLAARSPAELARSRIAIVTTAGNPLGITSLADLARSDVRTALGQRSSSIGRYARWALSNLSIEAVPTLELPTARAVLAAVREGKVDAGIVYTTTFQDAGSDLTRIDITAKDNQPVLYSISVDREAREPAGAAAFRALALSAEGQEILRGCGFLAPGEK